MMMMVEMIGEGGNRSRCEGDAGDNGERLDQVTLHRLIDPNYSRIC
jgi:hypothetical protein